MDKMEVGNCYYFKWLDACNRVDWFYEKDAIEWFKSEEFIVRQVAWLVYEDEHSYGFASKKSSYSECENQFGLMLKLPKTWIKRFEEIDID